MNPILHHTPGPWIIAHSKGEFDNSYWIGPERHFTIAKVEHGAADEEYGGPEAELANARLIAASPEMLEALRASRAIFTSILRNVAESIVIAEQVAIIDAVLAKAGVMP